MDTRDGAEVQAPKEPRPGVATTPGRVECCEV
jgi:hypothetical protein